MDIVVSLLKASFSGIVKLSYDLSWLWISIALGFLFVRVWLYYVRSMFLSGLERTLLEVKLPKDTFKSPMAMELVLNAFHQGHREANWYVKYIKGSSRPWSSLELVSIGGDIHFFIWIEADGRTNIENAIYAQYPNVEIHEVDDYVNNIDYGKGNEGWKMWGCEFKFTKADPYPIKTYVDYGLDKDPKEEFKIEPMNSSLEFLGSLDSDSQVWLQIIIRANKEKIIPGRFFPKKVKWKKEGEELVDKIRADALKKGGEDQKTVPLTEGEKTTISAIGRNISKYGFDVGIRGVYLAKKESFNPANIGGLMGMVKQYGSEDLNGFKPMNTPGFDFPWQDPTKMRESKNKIKLLNAYKRRGFFFQPYRREFMVLNTEELATMYHFPGRVSETPTFKRIDSKKAEPPSNLPTQ